MPALLLSIFRFVRLLLSGHQAVAIENAALRLQLAAFQRKRKRPVLTTFDRVFWIALSPLLVRLAPAAALRTGRHRRPLAARAVSQVLGAAIEACMRRRRGRPATAVEIRRLIERMVAANPLWRAPRIHGELKMLGIADLRAHGLPNSPDTPPAADSDLEDVSSQPHRPIGVD